MGGGGKREFFRESDLTTGQVTRLKDTKSFQEVSNPILRKFLGDFSLNKKRAELFGKSVLADELDPANLSPNGQQPRLPRGLSGGFLGSAAARSLSRSGSRRSTTTGVGRPLLSGY